jgi:hypothetical protein
VNQVYYSLLNRAIETNGVLETAKELGVTIIAYTPLEEVVKNFWQSIGMTRQIATPALVTTPHLVIRMALYILVPAQGCSFSSVYWSGVSIPPPGLCGPAGHLLPNSIDNP